MAIVCAIVELTSSPKVWSPSLLNPLIVALHDPAARVRIWAARGLGRIPDPQVLNALGECAMDAHQDVRLAAIESLGNFADPRVVEPLAAYLSDIEPDIRLAAVCARRGPASTTPSNH